MMLGLTLALESDKRVVGGPMKSMFQLGKATLSFSLLAGLIFSFQNCSGKNFESIPVVDVECNVAEGCSSAASTADEEETPPADVTPVQTGGGAVFGPSPATNQHTYLNFVAGDQHTCEASVVSRTGKHVTCTIGGGCGNCGIPSASCASANPTVYGACVLH